MADGGVSLSLDDYIKVKRKQGGFKMGRKSAGVVGKGGSVGKGGPKQQQRKRGAATGKFPVQQQRKGQRKAANQGQQLQQNRRNRQKGANRFNNNASPQRQNQFPRNRNQRLRGIRSRGLGAGRVRGLQTRNNFQGGVSQHLVRSIRGGFGGRRGGNRQGGRGRTIQPLMGRLISSHNVQRANNYAGILPRANNRRIVQKFAKKRVQKARLQLAKGRLPGRVGRASMGHLISNSRVRLLRNGTGLITVRDPVEKQLQRMIIQQKIQRAQEARNKMNRGPNRLLSDSRNSLQVQVANRRPRYSRPQQQGLARGRRPARTTRYDEYDPYEPAMNVGRGRSSMYSDVENVRNASHEVERRFGMSSRGRLSPPIVRTTRNNEYIASRPEEFDLMNSSLNPEIQKKISFIQNRNRLNDPPGIIADFRAPIVSSTMKLGDRFKMYMH